MEIKKSPKADLESKKSTWLLVGLCNRARFHVCCVQWTKRDIKIDTSQAITDVFLKRKSSLLQNSRSRLLLRLRSPFNCRDVDYR